MVISVAVTYNISLDIANKIILNIGPHLHSDQNSNILFLEAQCTVQLSSEILVCADNCVLAQTRLCIS